jgi:SulP family sulfate permease
MSNESAAPQSESVAPHNDVAGDVLSGLAAMLVAFPAAIAFGVTIFSPLGGDMAAQGAIAGIVGAIAFGLVAPLMGGSSRLISAPCAPAAAVLSALAIEYTHAKMAPGSVVLLLSLIGLLAGGVQITLGAVRIGKLIKYIPFPVVSGYLCGVGLIIIGGQIPKFLGAPSGTAWTDAVISPSLWNWHSLLVGVVVIAAMILTPRLTHRVPSAIVALAAGIGCYLLQGLANPALLNTDGNPLLIGTLTSGDGGMIDGALQHWKAIGGLGFGMALKVVVPALTLAVLLSIDTLKTCLVIDALTSSQHNPNRELIGQGLANMASALMGGVPGSGTMGPSLVNVSSGGKTRASALAAGGFSLAAYLVLSPLVAWVPVAALAAILIVVGLRMIDWHSLAFFFTPSTRFDFLVIISVILVALFGNLIAASGVGVALSILLFIREQTRSSVVRHRIDGTEMFSKRSRSRKDMELLAREGADTVVFELQGSLFFGTANQLFQALEPESHERRYVILSMRRVQSLDITATHVLEQIKDRLEEHDGYLVFCDIPKGLPSGLKMKRFLKETGVVRPTNKAVAFRHLDEALEWVEARKLGLPAPGEEALGEEERPPLALKEMRIFSACADDALAALLAVVEERSVKADKKVFKAGEGDEALFLVRRGTVKVEAPVGKKESYHLATCGPGEIVGGMGFIANRGHATDGLAIEDTDVYVLTRAKFDELEKLYPELALVILEAVALGLAGRLRVTIGELQALRMG